MTAGWPSIPAPARLWQPFRFWVWAVYSVVIVAALPDYVVQYWFNQSLGFKAIFWTNLAAELSLFFGYGILLGFLVWLPIRRHAASPTLRTAGIHLSAWIGAFGGWLLARCYQEFLLAFHGVPFGSSDPVFGKDIGFYVYWLPVLRDSIFALEAAILVGIGFTLAARADALQVEGIFDNPEIPPRRKVGLLLPPFLNYLLYALGAVAVAHTWVTRYGLLLQENDATGVRTGAAYVDLTGFFSSLNNIYVKMFVEAGLTLVVGICIARIWKSAQPSLATPLKWGAGL